MVIVFSAFFKIELNIIKNFIEYIDTLY